MRVNRERETNRNTTTNTGNSAGETGISSRLIGFATLTHSCYSIMAA
jgi:hypothetical protein